MPHEFGCVEWRGVVILKKADALMVQQELIWETKPDLIVETGTKFGGSARFYGDLGVDVVTTDVAPPKPPIPHPRVTYLNGYSTSPQNLYTIGTLTPGRRVMVVLDSDHSYENVAAELDVYAPMVTEGCYLIVEDVVLGGPQQALDEWLPAHPEFRLVDIPHVPEHAHLVRL